VALVKGGKAGQLKDGSEPKQRFRCPFCNATTTEPVMTDSASIIEDPNAVTLILNKQDYIGLQKRAIDNNMSLNKFIYTRLFEHKKTIKE
jgi:hypothetical protein